jgi:glyoxylate/hydroxypyruvate reductase A
MKAVFTGNLGEAERQRWLGALAAALPEVTWLTPDEARAQAAQVRAAVVANPPPGALAGLPQLGLIQSLWAGVERLLEDPTLPEGVPIARMVDPALATAMAETALWAVLALHRGFFTYQRRQRQGAWQQHRQRGAAEVRVLILGRGEMGRAVEQALAQRGYPLTLWHREAGALPPLLATHEIAINVLPLTRATRGLLDKRFFAAMPAGAAVVNLARGAHLVDADLLAALDSAQLSHAVLDVFHREPLPAEHPFWRHPAITLLPHAAALTDERSAAAVVAANLRAFAAGEPVAHLVDRQRGY